jgi:hypothetical protein
VCHDFDSRPYKKCAHFARFFQNHVQGSLRPPAVPRAPFPAHRGTQGTQGAEEVEEVEEGHEVGGQVEAGYPAPASTSRPQAHRGPGDRVGRQVGR